MTAAPQHHLHSSGKQPQHPASGCAPSPASLPPSVCQLVQTWEQHLAAADSKRRADIPSNLRPASVADRQPAPFCPKVNTSCAVLRCAVCLVCCCLGCAGTPSGCSCCRPPQHAACRAVLPRPLAALLASGCG